MFNFDIKNTLLRRIFLTTTLFFAVTAVSIIGGRDARAAVIDLGFALDKSGSIAFGGDCGGVGCYKLAKEALANALGTIPTGGTDQYRVGVVSFDGSADTVVAPTIVTAASIGAIQAAINSDNFDAGGTAIHAGIDKLVADFDAAPGGLNSLALMNVVTDGQSSQSALLASSADAFDAGWTGLSFECVGSDCDPGDLADASFPNSPGDIIASGGAVPDPITQGFVLQVVSFDTDFEAALTSKIQAIVKPPAVPVPAAVWLFGTALIGFIGVSRRRKVA